jgi:hypothetical protein
MKKEFKTWLILNTKTGKFRVASIKQNMKTLTSRLTPVEVPIELTMNVDVPPTPILKAQGEIKLSQLQISNLLLSEIEDDEEQKL